MGPRNSPYGNSCRYGEWPLWSCHSIVIRFNGSYALRLAVIGTYGIGSVSSFGSSRPAAAAN